VFRIPIDFGLFLLGAIRLVFRGMTVGGSLATYDNFYSFFFTKIPAA